MLFLLFELDGERYALEASAIVEVMAPVTFKSIPGTPAWIAGLFERHAVPVPVIDVPMLALGRAARMLRSTRLVLVRYRRSGRAHHAVGDRDESRVLGLIVERATQTRHIAREQFVDSGVLATQASWLGPVARDASGLVQWVDVQQMLGDTVKAVLFPPLPSRQQQEPIR